MSIKPTCETCGKELNTFGAILLSPPDKKGKILKSHFCRICFSRLRHFISCERHLAKANISGNFC